MLDELSAQPAVGSCRGEDLVDFDAMVDRLALAFPRMSRGAIEDAARVEHEVRYGCYVAVPRDLEGGVAEVLALLTDSGLRSRPDPEASIL
jgi:hypothetical protein